MEETLQSYTPFIDDLDISPVFNHSSYPWKCKLFQYRVISFNVIISIDTSMTHLLICINPTDVEAFKLNLQSS